MNLLRTFGAALLLVAALLDTASARSGPPIRLVVPYPAGAMGDTVARLIAGDLAIRLGDPVIVENKPGAGGNLGTSEVARAAPDGRTLLVGATNNFVVNQFLYRTMGFDPLEALQPVTMLVEVPSVVFVNASLPPKSLQEFVDWLHAHPGAGNYASPGSGTTPHLSMLEINRALGVTMMHVPYQGAAPALRAVLAGEVQACLAGAGLGLPYVRQGSLRAIAVSSNDRLSILPRTPTFREVGLPGVRASNWWAIAAPRGTPDALVDRVATEVRSILGEPQMKQRLEDLGVHAIADGPEAMRRRLAREVGYWRRVVVDSGARVD
jgi:tripartite-type tricarboxylate transporter receptor subunit TctC